MSERSDFKMLLERQLSLYHELKTLLTAALDKRTGSVWGCEQVFEVNNYIDRLKELDNEISRLNPDSDKINRSRALTGLLSDLREIMLNVKDLLNVFQIRIEGGLQQTSGQLKATVKNLEIKGYQCQKHPVRNHACGVF